MNKPVLYLFGIFLIGLIYGSCKKEVAYPPGSYPNNTIVATVTGSIAESGTFIYTPQNCSYSKGILSIGGSCTVYEEVNTLGLYVHAKQVGTYTLSMYNSAGTGGSGSGSQVVIGYSTDSLRTGILTLTKLDTINKIVAGTFNFIAEEQYPFMGGGTETTTNGYVTNLTW